MLDFRIGNSHQNAVAMSDTVTTAPVRIQPALLEGRELSEISNGQVHQRHAPDSPGSVLASSQDGRVTPLPASVPDVYKQPSSISTGNRQGSEQREEVQKALGRALVVRCDGNYKAPVITLNTDGGAANVYPVIEKHFRPESLFGPEKFWKLVRTDLAIETWRPRVHGVQLKALSNVRLPETDEEFEYVETAVAQLDRFLRPESTPQLFVSDLRARIASIENWWDNRNKRPDGSLKRHPTGGPGSGSAHKRQNIAHATFGVGSDNYAGLPVVGTDTGYCGYVQNSRQGIFGFGGDSRPGFMEMITDGGSSLREGNEEKRHSVAPLSPRSLIYLNVGGLRYMTGLSTLLAVQGSYFWSLFQSSDMESILPKSTSGDYFIDRNGRLFGYVLEYLRAVANGETTCPLPDDPRDLQALARESEFFQLPGLMERIQSTSIMPQPSTRCMYDSLYLETGFNSIEGPNLREMEQRKVVVMSQLNHVVQAKQADGYFIEVCKCGVSHREGPDGCMQHNLFYHILLKKVVPILARGRM